ncbi:hypothetical protein [Bacillus cereus]|uniref:hypothetical protein n=1 Tax=Bacillus cereus TaxID=1396 RepID=UPI0009530327|nr:hypothetical protein [Bacillus cereus]OLR26839.1 hypothetical protein BLD50_05030 [Bacillus cereus]
MKKPNKFSVVIPVVSVLTIGNILPITSFAAETNGLPHSKTNMTHSMYFKTGVDTKIHSLKRPKSKAGTDTSANTDLAPAIDME